MTLRSRRILFYTVFIAFLAISYVAVMYAQGYKYSFSERKFIRTGAISLKINKDAKVFMEDKLIGSTSFIGNTFGVDRLLPGQYTIRLQKDDYSVWQKKITVQEGHVTDFPRVMLIPQSEELLEKVVQEIEELFAEPQEAKPTPTPSNAEEAKAEPEEFYLESGILYRLVYEGPQKLAGNVRGFELSSNKRKLMYWTRNELWVLWLDEPNYQPLHEKEDKELITRLLSPISKAAWFRGEDHIVVESRGYRIVEIDTRGGINIIKI
jgi:hypothetical protein